MVDIPESTLNLYKILHAMDQAGLRTRDFTVLVLINEDPGISSNALCPRLGLPMRSMIREPLARLIDRGLVIDKRVRAQKAVMTRLHITEKGLRVLREPHKIKEILAEQYDL